MGNFDSPLATTTPMWWGVRDPELESDVARSLASDTTTLATEGLFKRAVPTTHPIRDMRDRWSDTLRDTVRDHPLATLVGALAIGALLGRIRR